MSEILFGALRHMGRNSHVPDIEVEFNKDFIHSFIQMSKLDFNVEGTRIAPQAPKEGKTSPDTSVEVYHHNAVEVDT